MACILLVDDDKDILKLGSHVLSASGHFIFTAEGAQEALDLLSRKSFDLIITDANMPRHSGFDLIQTIKKTKKIKHIPVAFLTGRREKKDIQKALQLGAVDYIVKPLDPFLLIQKVTQILNQFSSNVQSLNLAKTRISNLAKLTYDITITNISEVGIEIHSTEKLTPGLKIDIDTPLFNEIGIKKPFMKVLNASENKPSQNFIIKLQFIGMNDSDLSKIRAWMLRNTGNAVA